MIRAFSVSGDTLVESTVAPGSGLPPGAIWIDMIEPTADEDRHVEQLTGVAIPTREEMREIEESSRLYAEGGAIYLTAPVLFAAGTNQPGIAPVTFVLTDTHLITVRYSMPTPFVNYAARASKPGNLLIFDACAPVSILFGLIDAITDRIADILENVTQRLDAESERLITGVSQNRPMSTADFRAGLKLIGKEGEFLSKVRESLAGISRMLVYIQAMALTEKGKSQNRTWLKSLERDVESLGNHVSYLSDRTTFLLDTVIGMVSVEQNAIIKIFSVAAVVFMPPTLVASIYGMNFDYMPELQWMLGYPFAIGLMVVAALLPLLYFRHRGWL